MAYVRLKLENQDEKRIKCEKNIIALKTDLGKLDYQKAIIIYTKLQVQFYFPLKILAKTSSNETRKMQNNGGGQ